MPGSPSTATQRRRPAHEHAQHRVELCELGVASDDRPGKGVGAHPAASLTRIGSDFRDLGGPLAVVVIVVLLTFVPAFRLGSGAQGLTDRLF